MTTDIVHIQAAAAEERRHQDRTHGALDQHPHTVGEWLLIVERELEEAKAAWVNYGGDDTALTEILQVYTVAQACMEQHGLVKRSGERVGRPASP